MFANALKLSRFRCGRPAMNDGPRRSGAGYADGLSRIKGPEINGRKRVTACVGR